MPAVSSDLIAPPKKTVAENVRETLESIVVAFILAFVFRAFIVEAFVIPTGSMAPTLYGDHLTNTCSACGFEYAVGMPPRSGSPEIKLQCPNCNLLVNKFERSQTLSPDSGDRILVHKWPFDIGGPLLGPKRWDVTVFKDPRDGVTNFIKRLVGLPGEVLEIIDGDVYTASIDQLKPELVAELDRLRKAVYELRVTGENRRHAEFINRYAAVNKQLLPELKIQRKKRHETLAQESLWFNVYDHDFLPDYEHLRGPTPGDRVGWQPVSGTAGQAWRTADRELSFNSERAGGANEPLYIEFTGKPIDDLYAYNNDGASERDQRGRNLVGDVRLRFVWFPDAGQGALSMKMNRDRDEFVATVNVDGSVRVDGFHPDSDLPGHRQVIDEKQLKPFRPGRAVEIDFINLDYRVALFIDGREVIASTDEEYSPRLQKLSRFIEASIREEDGDLQIEPTRVRIGARGLNCRLRHVKLERDVYYRSQKQSEDRQQDQSAEHNAYYLWPGWGTAGFPILLRPAREIEGKKYFAEYFMLGDNSPASKDSRMWWEIGPHLRYLDEEYQVGTVPEDQLIGKAFFVYWPAGYRLSWFGGIGVVPNVGKMRWIR